MKTDNLLRATSAVLLFTLNILAGVLIGSMKDIKADVKSLGSKIQDVQIRLYGAEKDITTLQKPSYQLQPHAAR